MGIPLFKGDEGLLRPDGHLLWERRLGRTMFAPTVRSFWFGKGVILMLMEQVWKQLKAALEERVDWAVYDEYDPVSFDKRPEWFLTLGVSGVEMQSPFLGGEYLYYPFSAAVKVTLLAPPETDARTLYDCYCRKVFSGMLSAGCTAQKIRVSAPEVLRQFRRSAVVGTYQMDGVFRMRREEALLV